MPYKKLFLFLSLLSINLTANANDSKSNIQAHFAEIKVATKESKNIWGINLYGPILLVNTSTREIYSNFSDSENVLTKEGTIYKGVLPKEINIANTSLTWNGRDWAMIMLPLSKNKNDRINLLAHELFHRIQAKLGFNISDRTNVHLDLKKGRILLRLELEALKNALASQSVSERDMHLRNAFIFRKHRYLVFENAKKSENLLELNEGLAEYTGDIVSQRNNNMMIEHLNSSIDVFFKKTKLCSVICICHCSSLWLFFG